MVWQAPNRAPDGLVTILGPPLFIIMGLLMLNNEYLSTTINPALGFGLIVLGVALPILTLMMLRAPDSVDDKAPEVEFHDGGRVSLVINEPATDEND